MLGAAYRDGYVIIGRSKKRMTQTAQMQIVYLSNRPKQLQETLQHVALFMPFINQAIVCIPGAMTAEFVLNDSNLPLQVITEAELLSEQELAKLGQLDHQQRNYLLRTRLIKHSDIGAQFIMSDDDARPLRNIERSRFIDETRYRHYYFYELREWLSNQTSFDAGQLSTCAVLQHHNLPQLSYASHMPQIIDKMMFLEAATFFAADSERHALCEWSSYFNFATAKYPERFHAAQPYLTLCWPEHPLAWKKFVAPEEYLFENFTAACYHQNRVFDGLSSSVAEDNIEKVVRWHKYEIACIHPEQGNSWLKYLNWRTWVNKIFKHTSIK